MTRRMLLLTHTGRKSGLARSTVLEVVESSERGPLVVSGFGRRSDWYRNVIAHPQVGVDWAGQRFSARARELDENSAAQVFERYREQHPKAAAVISRRLDLPMDVAPAVAARELPVLVLDRS